MGENLEKHQNGRRSAHGLHLHWHTGEMVVENFTGQDYESTEPNRGICRNPEMATGQSRPPAKFKVAVVFVNHTGIA